MIEKNRFFIISGIGAYQRIQNYHMGAISSNLIVLTTAKSPKMAKKAISNFQTNDGRIFKQKPM